MYCHLTSESNLTVHSTWELARKELTKVFNSFVEDYDTLEEIYYDCDVEEESILDVERALTCDEVFINTGDYYYTIRLEVKEVHND